MKRAIFKNVASMLMLALAVGMADIVLAEAMVYETASRTYSPYLTKTETVIWENRSLADIMSFTCTLKGGWIGAPTTGTGVIYDRTPTTFTVQFQCVNGGCKTVRAYFRQEGANIVARADAAGRGNDGEYRNRLADSVFTTALATSDGGNGYGVYGIEAFGDANWTIDAVPPNEDGVVVSNGTLLVNVAADTTVATAISGNGVVRFAGSGQKIETEHEFGQYVTTANQTLIENADVFDIVITSAVFNGGWCGRCEGALPYNVTSNVEAKTMKVQLQKQFPNTAIRGLVIQLSQSGSDVLIKGIVTRQAGSEQGLGSDVETWNGASPSIATSASANGYGLESISFVKRALPTVVLSGTKGWTGGTIVDGCLVKVKESQLAAATDVRVMNGGRLDLFARGYFDVFTRNRYRVEADSTLGLGVNFALNRRDAIDADGGMVTYLTDGITTYITDMTLANGAAVNGTCNPQTGYDVDALWRVEGETESVVDTPLSLVRSVVSFIIDTAADVVFRKHVHEHSGYPGAPVVKRGSAKATFAAGCSTTGAVTLAAGSVRFGEDSSFGPLVVDGTVGVEVDAGKTLTFDASAAQTWASDAVLGFIGAFDYSNHVVRFGTDATGLAKAQLNQIRINGERCVLDNSGWLHPVRKGIVIMIQ